MKLKTISALLITILIMTLLTGCAAPHIDIPAKAENIHSGKSVSTEITDSDELEKLWQDYLYDAIATVFNTRKFNTANEIDPLQIAQYIWFKYTSENNVENLAYAGKESMLRLLPLDTVLEYTKRYFNLDSLDLAGILKEEYDPQRKDFLLGLGSNQAIPSYKDANAFGIEIKKVLKNNDGIITAELVRYATYESKRIECVYTCSMKQRKDGSLYFLSGKQEYINNKLVAIKGAYKRFDNIKGYTGNFDDLLMIDETDNSIIMAYTPYDTGKRSVFILVDKKTFNIKKQLNLEGNVPRSEFRLIGGNLAVLYKNKVITYSKALKKLKEIPVPEAILKKQDRKPRYNQTYHRDDNYFGGYDVSADFKKFAYSDETGVKLFDAASNREKLLAKTIMVQGGKETDRYPHSVPRFVSDCQKVITTLLGYEGSMGYVLCDLQKNTSKEIKISQESSSTSLIRYDNGILEVNTNGAGGKTFYLDFNSGSTKEIILQNPRDTGFIRFPGDCYTGSNYAAFVTTTANTGMYYISRLNLKTLKNEPEIVSISTTAPNILGVLKDGRIIFSYYLNPSEYGICVTDKLKTSASPTPSPANSSNLKAFSPYSQGVKVNQANLKLEQIAVMVFENQMQYVEQANCPDDRQIKDYKINTVKIEQSEILSLYSV